MVKQGEAIYERYKQTLMSHETTHKPVLSGEVPSLPPTAYRYPLSTATPTPSRRVLIEAARAHRFV